MKGWVSMVYLSKGINEEILKGIYNQMISLYFSRSSDGQLLPKQCRMEFIEQNKDELKEQINRFIDSMSESLFELMINKRRTSL
jgi:hypothetical protein